MCTCLYSYRYIYPIRLPVGCILNLQILLHLHLPQKSTCFYSHWYIMTKRLPVGCNLSYIGTSESFWYIYPREVPTWCHPSLLFSERSMVSILCHNDNTGFRARSLLPCNPARPVNLGTRPEVSILKYHMSFV